MGTEARARAPAGQPAPKFGGGVTQNAVALGVATHTGRNVSSSFGPMMLRAHRPVGPHGFRWVKAATPREVFRWSAQCDSCALMASETERLRPVTRRAVRRILPRSNRVQSQEVVRVNVARAHATVVAIGAVALGVAAHAQLRVVAGDELVAHQKVGVVPCVEQPIRGFEAAFWKLGAHATGVIGKVTRRALARSVTASRFWHLVAVETAAHAWQLLARREFDSGHLAMTLRTPDIAPTVRLMRELEVGIGKTLARHAVARLGSIADVAVATLSYQVRRDAFHGAQVSVVALMARIARRCFW